MYLIADRIEIFLILFKSWEENSNFGCYFLNVQQMVLNKYALQPMSENSKAWQFEF